MVERMVRRVVERIAADAPDGWTRALLTRRAGWGEGWMTGHYEMPGVPPGTQPVPESRLELTRLAEAVRQLRGWEPQTYEITCRRSGEYRLVASPGQVAGLDGAQGFQVVLDPGYRLPEAGLEQPESTAAPAGDPAAAQERLRSYLRKRAEILGGTEPLPPPAAPAALDEVERRIGRSLPGDLRALYAIADGDGIDHGYRRLMGGFGWLAVADLVAAYDELREPAWFGWDMEWNRVVFDSDPPGAVRRCSGHPGWLPFATGEDGNFLAVDLSPAREGRPGQVIQVGRDYDGGPSHLADSVTSLLGRYLGRLERGDYEHHDGRIQMFPYSDPRPQWAVGGLPDEIQPAVQAMTIADLEGPVDLAPLTAAPNLRHLNLVRCATADLAPLRSLPVECLLVTLDGGDLTPLQGHRLLRSLELGTTGHIEIAPLRTVPRLRALDLTQAEVRDLTTVADLDDLRYLALTPRQWDIVLDAGGVPATLAAARLSGGTPTEARDWAARLGLATGRALVVTGTID